MVSTSSTPASTPTSRLASTITAHTGSAGWLYPAAVLCVIALLLVGF